MKLAERDRIESAWSENCSGPGWNNQIIWVLVRDGGGGLRLESIQPDERTEQMAVLHDISAVVTMEMTACVRAMCRHVE